MAWVRGVPTAVAKPAEVVVGSFPASVNLANVDVFVGALLGAMLVFLFSSLAIRAVGKTASAIIEEVRRQFRETPASWRARPTRLRPRRRHHLARRAARDDRSRASSPSACRLPSA